jgi:hypothetical protein
LEGGGKMHKKSMFFGIGVGILVMVAVSFVTYTVQRASYLNEQARLMAMVEDLEARPQAAPVDTIYVVNRARDIGMVFPDEIEPEIVIYIPEPDEAQHLHNVNAGNGDYDDPVPPEEARPEAQVEPTPSPDSPALVYTPTHVGMLIRPGLTASEAAFYFEEMGLVDDANEFSQYLIDNGYSTSIRAGYHIVPRGVGFRDIVNIIVYGN